jgi:hypothetical protein
MLVEGGGQIGQIERHERHCIDVRARIRVTRIATFAVPFDGCAYNKNPTVVLR